MFGIRLLNRRSPLRSAAFFLVAKARLLIANLPSESRKQAVERGTAVEKKRFVGTLEEKTAVKCPIAWAFP